MDKFITSGWIHNRCHEVFRPIRNEAVELLVLEHVEMDNQQSISQVARASGVATVILILNVHPYKIMQVQELNESWSSISVLSGFQRKIDQ